jgi:uncharacterized protein (TIGR02284 family)
MDKMEIRSILIGIVDTCKDSQQGFRKAAVKVKHPEIQTLFQNYSRVRGEFARELHAEVALLGGAPAKSATIAMQSGWSELETMAPEYDDRAILEIAERGEDLAVKSYRDALYKDLPDNLRKIVERQYREIRQTHKNVRVLRDSGWPTIFAPMAGLV